jgi:hypothetical protein
MIVITVVAVSAAEFRFVAPIWIPVWVRIFSGGQKDRECK